MKQSLPKPEQVDDPSAIRAAAMRWLARREYSVLELSQKLAQRGFDRETLTEVVVELVSERLVSDQRCAEAVVRSAQQRGLGPLRLRHQLQQLGIDEALVQEAMQIDEAEWREQMRHVWQKRFGEPPADRKAWAKQARFLQSRGFSPDQIRWLLDHLDEC